LRGVLSTREDIEISYTNYTKQTRFESVSTWSESEAIDLMKYHLEHERRLRRGINNNLSLVNHAINYGETSYSLLAFRRSLFQSSIYIISPFKAVPDARMIVRMETTFTQLKTHSRLFDRNGNEIVSENRLNIINLLVSRIMTGFNWSGNLWNYKIRRYRLNWLLSCPKFDIDRNIDIHHKNGLQGILDTTDDRFINLVALRRDAHRTIHFLRGDDNFVDM
jgi:hypothetical protein